MFSLISREKKEKGKRKGKEKKIKITNVQKINVNGKDFSVSNNDDNKCTLKLGTDITIEYDSPLNYIGDLTKTEKELDLPIAKKIQEKLGSGKVILFVFGITGSGKNTFIEQLKNKLGINEEKRVETTYYFLGEDNTEQKQSKKDNEYYTQPTPFNEKSTRGFCIEKFKTGKSSNENLIIINVPGCEPLENVLNLSLSDDFIEENDYIDVDSGKKKLLNVMYYSLITFVWVQEKLKIKLLLVHLLYNCIKI